MNKAQQAYYVRPRTRGMVLVLVFALAVGNIAPGAVMDGWDYAKAMTGLVLAAVTGPAGPYVGFLGVAVVDQMERGARRCNARCRQADQQQTLWTEVP